MARRKVDIRKDEILRATCEEVAERGFAGTRAADVAARLGVSAGLIFYHFENKDALLSAAFQYAAARDLERLHAEASAPGKAQQRLARILALYAPDGVGTAWALWIDAWAAALRSPGLAEVSRALDVQWKETVARVIADGADAGELKCADPSAAAWRITALIDGLAVQATVHPGLLTKRAVQTWVVAAAAAELGLDPADLRP